MIDWLNAHLASFRDDENPFHNSSLSKILTYLRIAYATWGENPLAGDFRRGAAARQLGARSVSDARIENS